MIVGFDELNIVRSMPYEQFFGEMELTEEQVEKRIKLAKEFEDIYLFFLFWMMELIESKTINYAPVKRRIAEKWADATRGYLYDEDFIIDYANQFADNAVEATLRHIDDEWYFSEDRVRFNAENEALTVFNRADFLDAVEAGYTTKRWLTILDNRERHSHRIAHGQTVGIYDYFYVGAAKMFHPRDTSIGNGALHPEEIINCRCRLAFGNGIHQAEE